MNIEESNDVNDIGIGVSVPSKFNIIFKNLMELVKCRGDDVDAFEKSIEQLLQNKVSIEIPIGKVPDIPRLYARDICVLLMLDAKQEYKKALMHIINEVLTGEQGTPQERLKHFLDEYGDKKQYVLVFLKGKPISKNDENKLNNFDKMLMKAGRMLHYFMDHRFRYNPMEHIYVPYHRKCSKEEEQQIMQKYMIDSKSKMPVISKNDPVANWIGLKPGDIVEITRSNTTSGTTLFYRVCI